MSLGHDGQTPHPPFEQLPMVAFSLPFSPEALQARFGEGWNTYNDAQREAVQIYHNARAGLDAAEYPDGRSGERQPLNPLVKLELAMRRTLAIADRTEDPRLREERRIQATNLLRGLHEWEARRRADLEAKYSPGVLARLTKRVFPPEDFKNIVVGGAADRFERESRSQIGDKIVDSFAPTLPDLEGVQVADTFLLADLLSALGILSEGVSFDGFVRAQAYDAAMIRSAKKGDKLFFGELPPEQALYGDNTLYAHSTTFPRGMGNYRDTDIYGLQGGVSTTEVFTRQSLEAAQGKYHKLAATDKTTTSAELTLYPSINLYKRIASGKRLKPKWFKPASAIRHSHNRQQCGFRDPK